MERSRLKRTQMTRGGKELKRTRFKKHLTRGWQMDAATSRAVRERDGWRCVKCKRRWPEGSPELTCSHFYRRAVKATRHYADNLDSLCLNCHTGQRGWEYQKAEGQAYYDFKLRQLGPERFEALRVLANQTKVS